jgi:hypothetical protein
VLDRALGELVIQFAASAPDGFDTRSEPGDLG